MELRDWTSLRPLTKVAHELAGSVGVAWLESWLNDQIARVEDLSFAQDFQAAIEMPDQETAAFCHRLVHGRGGSLLGGIRFFGGDHARPFVDVFAHNFEDLAALKQVVAAQWAAFHPCDLRLLCAPAQMQALMRMPLEVRLDLTLHAARCNRMMPPDGRVTLRPFDDVGQAVDLVQARYGAVVKEAPALANNISAASVDELEGLHQKGQLQAIHAAGRLVGALALAPGEVGWIKGFEVMEEVITVEARGQGYAASAQSAWAAHVDQDALMIGMIDGLNTASRRSAERAGRPAVLCYAFVALNARSKGGL